MGIDIAAQDPAKGLSATDVARLRARHGWNELPRARPPSPGIVLLRQFRGLLVLILAVAAALAFLLGERIDALAILLVLVLNAILGFVQEWRAETALDALRSLLSVGAIVRRDGAEVEVPARDIVPGDIVVVATGAAVPADIDLVDGAELQADESTLTGESMPVAKMVGEAGEAGRLFAGTALVSGRAVGRATATGAATRFGHVAELTGRVTGKQTNLQRRLAGLARQVGIVSLGVAGAVILIGWLVGRPVFEMVMTGLSLAVAMVPEGLPAVVTITLALGATAMARKRALVRRLQAVETLGAASVICTDKTGTLTENQMTVTRVQTPSHGYEVTGEGYAPEGRITCDGERVRADDPVLAALLETAAICNDASLRRDDGRWSMIGTPTEGALLALSRKGGRAIAAERLAEVPFTSERKRMAVLTRHPDGIRLHVKGAPETVLDRADRYLAQDGIRPLDPATRARIVRAEAEMAGEGLRVIALAARPAAAGDLDETGLVFAGLVGIIDPPRAEVPGAIALAHAAGVRIVVITGDGATTAAAIAANIGLGAPAVIDGGEIDGMSDDDLAARLRGDVLFARTRPEHKLRIVAALQAGGQIVAMTGDGVNDAPALKQADIGIAMGQRGTEVSRNAADLILLDDNFATIVDAIGEGRRQFDNVRKFVHYLLCSNAGEVLAIVVNLVMGGPLIFLATQILWMNLVTDGATAVALGLERSEPDQMARPPRRPETPILGRAGLGLILCFGVYTASASLAIFYTLLPLGTDLARTAAFTGMLVFEKASVFAFRSFRRPVTSFGWASNRVLIVAFSASLALQVAAVYWGPLQTLLRTVPLGPDHWLAIVLLSLPLIAVPELVKAVWRRPDAAPAGRREAHG